MTHALSHRQQFRRNVLNHLAIDCWIDTSNVNIKTQPFASDTEIVLTSQHTTASALPLYNHDQRSVIADPIQHIIHPVQYNNVVEDKPDLSQDTITANKAVTFNNTYDNNTLSFGIEAIYYGQYVLLVDNEYLDDNEQVKQLWHNICQGLNANIESLKFPLIMSAYAPLNDKKTNNNIALANASFKGFIFRMTGSKHAQLAKLTPLADCLLDDRFTDLPTLEHMIADPALKKQLWQVLSDKKTD